MRGTVRNVIRLLFMLTLVSASAVAEDQVATMTPALTPPQIARFLNSYPDVQALARDYWGERRYTPARKMLDPEGTFERAFSEIRAAGKQPDLDRLLQAHGFEDRRTWLRVAYRVADAYVALRTEEMGPEVMSRVRHALDLRYKALDVKQEVLEKETESERQSLLRSMAATRKKLDAERNALEEAHLLRPYAPQFAAIEDFMKHKKVEKYVHYEKWSDR